METGWRHHPNVLRIHDFGLDEQEGTLTDLIARRGALPPPVAAALLEQIADALSEAHAMGIVHGGLAPGNLLVDDAEATFPVLKSCDFGAGARGFTGWNAPEQLHEGPISPTVDVFSLGLLLAYVLTGQPLFSDHQAAEMSGRERLERFLGRALPGLGLRPPVVEVIWRACRWRAESRYPDTAALAAAFRAVVEGETRPAVSAPEPDIGHSAPPPESVARLITPRRVHTVEARQSAVVATGAARLRLTFMDTDVMSVHVHLKALNCFLRRPSGPLTRALEVKGNEAIELIRADRVNLGRLTLDVGSMVAGGRLFHLDQAIHCVPPQAILLDPGPDGEVYLIHQPDATKPRGAP